MSLLFHSASSINNTHISLFIDSVISILVFLLGELLFSVWMVVISDLLALTFVANFHLPGCVFPWILGLMALLFGWKAPRCFTSIALLR